MLTVPHTLVGSAIGLAVKNTPCAPALAFGLGWLSHYALDTVPHWERLYKPHDEGNFATDRPAKEWPRHMLVQAVLDVIIAGVIVSYIVVSSGGFSWNSPVLWGAIGSFLPDFLGNVPFWNRTLQRLPFFKQEYALHSSVHITPDSQKRYPRYYGLLTQIVAVVLSLAVIIRYH